MNGAGRSIGLLDRILPQSSARNLKVDCTEAATLTFGMRSEIPTGRPAQRTRKTTPRKLLGNLGGQSAYLLSHAKVCHRAYPFLAEAAIGISIEAMHLKGHVRTNRRKLLVGVKGGFHYTSLKGHKFNKMYWKLQGEYFDSDDPSVLVVPLLPLNQILNWATDHVHAIPYDVAVFTCGPRKQVVAAETLQFAKGICTPDEKTLARENITTFVEGIAIHLVTDVFESLPEKYFTSQNPSLLRWRELANQMRQKIPKCSSQLLLMGPIPIIFVLPRLA